LPLRYARATLTPDPLLLAAIRAVARSGDPDATLDELLEIGMRAAGADRAAAFLWDSEAGGLALAGSRGYPPDDLPTLESAASGTDHPIKLAAEERIQTIGRPDAGGRVLVAWPIVVGRDGIEEPVGSLALEVDHAPDADIGERVAALSDLVAVVVDRARLATNAAERIDWAERVGNSDALTGLANGRTVQRVMELELARAARQGLEISIALFDIDDLTGLNAAQGKTAGDDAIREVASVIMESVRFVDTVARWGPDEFLLVAPGATGTTVVRRIVEAVAARPIGEARCTVSAGLARFPLDGSTSDDLIAAATGALRAAQAAGPGTLAEVARDGNGTGAGIASQAAGTAGAAGA
jgi:diguanylate cyclase (GGDEF)-like protein